MMSDTTTPVASEAETEVEEALAGELTELARLEIRVGKILEVTAHTGVSFYSDKKPSRGSGVNELRHA